MTPCVLDIPLMSAIYQMAAIDTDRWELNPRVASRRITRGDAADRLSYHGPVCVNIGVISDFL